MTHTPRPTPRDAEADDDAPREVLERFIESGRELVVELQRIVSEAVEAEVSAETSGVTSPPATKPDEAPEQETATVSTQAEPCSRVTTVSAGSLLGSEEGARLDDPTPAKPRVTAGELLRVDETDAPGAGVGETPAQSTARLLDLGEDGHDTVADEARPSEAVTSAALPRPGPVPERGSASVGFSEAYWRKIDVLRALLERRDSVLMPEPAPFAALGHAVPEVDARLGVAPGEGIDALEELADLGLLDRELYNRVNVCPSCHRCQLNLREACPVCSSIDLDIERLIHHFHCAFSGLESEFEQGLELVCPKCRKSLQQLGQDFERPHETYVCRTSGHLFEQPYLEGQCLHCQHQFPGHELEVVRLYKYRPTILTIRAVELGRLTGLDVSEIMFDADLRLATKSFLEIELRRELLRIARHGGSFATAMLSFESHGRKYPFFREWSADTIRQMATVLASCFRSLDLVSRLDHARLGVLLIETDQDQRVGERALGALRQLVFRTGTGAELTPVWNSRSWSDPKTTVDEVLAFYGAAGDTA